METPKDIFHLGEIEIQTKVGVSAQADRLGRKAIRDHLPQQHQDFYSKLPMLFVGHSGYCDSDEQVWASVIAGEPGFIETPSSKSMSIGVGPLKGDPLANSIRKRSFNEKALNEELRLGVLGIELATRRRNRLTAKMSEATDYGFKLDILQSFGNCPQYIQNRKLMPNTSESPKSVVQITELDINLQNFIASADTFFVASSSKKSNDKSDSISGADVSHRGGSPGFIRVENGKQLIIPDFSGNNAFNTLGNIQVNPNTGLLFIDFATGDVITLTGKAKILWDHEYQEYFKGARRFWQFELTQGFLLSNALPYVFELNEASPNNQLTGTWAEAEQLKASSISKESVNQESVNKESVNQESVNKESVNQESVNKESVNAANLSTKSINASDLAKQSNQQNKQQVHWHQVSVSKIEDESSTIRSFWLNASVGPISEKVPDFLAGQHITVKSTINGKLEIRNYTVSSAPYDGSLRISVKRDGKFSNWLHSEIKINDTLEIKLPAGDFTLTHDNDRPTVLLSAGIGITPMISMLRQKVIESVRQHKKHSILMINSFRHAKEMAFVNEVSQLSNQATADVKTVWLLSKPKRENEPVIDFSENVFLEKGRLNKKILQQFLPIGKYNFYLCGPSGFMQDTYEILLELGVLDSDIKTESFGPSALKRIKVISNQKKQMSPAECAQVTFNSSHVEKIWNKTDGTLLEFAESHGLTPEFGCRGGSCGTCKVKVLKGQVVHSADISVDLEADEALLCCAKPANADSAGDYSATNYSENNNSTKNDCEKVKLVLLQV